MKKIIYNPKIHNRQSIRLKGYDYSRSGAYFITLNTENRARFFGEIKDGKMELNEAGENVFKLWKLIPEYFPFVELDTFIVMPDHFHGILIINESVGARLIAPRQNEEQNIGGFSGINNPMFHQNLSRIIRWFKGRSSFEIRKFDQSFKWQRNYYEHIIRNSQAFDRIATYILDNPTKWRE